MLTKGQTITSIITVAMFIIGGWVAQAQQTDEKIETSKSEFREVTLSQGNDIAALKEAVSTIKNDNGEMKRDIKEILKAVK